MATFDIPCRICGESVPDYLEAHVTSKHQITLTAYVARFPGAPTVSDRLLARFRTGTKDVHREHPSLNDLTLKIGSVNFPVNINVPLEACLPMPDHYRLPVYGDLSDDVQHALIALRFGRSTYIHGMPGSGKDGLFHAVSVMTRMPALIEQVAPGTDIESWFFSRSFNEKGTFWEEGAVLKALRDGYECPNGDRVPYMLLVTDFDRADREQGEHLRLILDSIQGRVKGPAGRIYKVFPGTRIVVTANTAGGGDERGRMTSANPIDASLLDRFEVKIIFHMMDWRDEGEICKKKFPHLHEKHSQAWPKMASVTKAIREAIKNDDLHGEFSHRGVCAILRHAEDILKANGNRVDPRLMNQLMARASRVWVDGLPDESTREEAWKLLDAQFGTLPDPGNPNRVPLLG
jgi:MoxR-like ATPase